MGVRRVLTGCLAAALAVCVVRGHAQDSSSSSSSSKPSTSSKSPTSKVRKAAPAADSVLDSGLIKDGVYRNSGFGFSCKIPAGWVLRTEEMNAPVEQQPTAPAKDSSAKPAVAAPSTTSRPAPGMTAEGDCLQSGGCGRVLLAAFARPPEVSGEDVNASIVIAAESVADYPGLKAAAQYFGPVTEIAAAKGFTVVNEAYDFPVGAKQLVRGDFAADRGSRVMRQSTLALLGHGYVVSFTFIGGTEDEVEELVEGLSFVAGGRMR
jgi:hypothetical protein